MEKKGLEQDVILVFTVQSSKTYITGQWLYYSRTWWMLKQITPWCPQYHRFSGDGTNQRRNREKKRTEGWRDQLEQRFQENQRCKNNKNKKGNTRITHLSNNILLARIEFSALVDVGSTGVAADAHRKHHPNFHLLVLRLPPPRYLGRIEVRRVVLVQDLAFSHLRSLRLASSAADSAPPRIPVPPKP